MRRAPPATQGGAPSSPARHASPSPSHHRADSPVKECGTPPRNWVSPPRQGPHGSLSASWRKRGGLREERVAGCQPWWFRSRAKQAPRSLDPDPEEGEIHDFWGQLWLVPNSQPRKRGARVQAERGEHLVWIQKELWDSKKFTPSDCCPVGEGDTWAKSPSKLSAAAVIWGEEGRRSFVQVVKESMAGRGRGRGPRPRSDGDWDRWGGGGWNPYHFPPPPPPPHFYGQPPPPPFGYYPHHPPQQLMPPL